MDLCETRGQTFVVAHYDVHTGAFRSESFRHSVESGRVYFRSSCIIEEDRSFLFLFPFVAFLDFILNDGQLTLQEIIERQCLC